MGVFKYCPFCGGQPALYGPEWRDDNRYVEMELTCCNITMDDHIAWSYARNLSPEEIKERLTNSLTAVWNDRYVPDLEEQESIEPDSATPINEHPNFARF
ncbi:hypothetical protein [Shinella zoogloeoides]|uniref:hypothetical protein n=1 Tax=Shinella zoogloeoides TaxID=352475 RepID=UPI00273F2D2E|nr:hypothetical protein [Shinella zoogloeoides]WLR90948.1 hypothetical protein Q9316_00800 [Shinella zoogloeoides]